MGRIFYFPMIMINLYIESYVNYKGKKEKGIMYYVPNNWIFFAPAASTDEATSFVLNTDEFGPWPRCFVCNGCDKWERYYLGGYKETNEEDIYFSPTKRKNNNNKKKRKKKKNSKIQLNILWRARIFQSLTMAARGLGLFLASTGLAFNGFLGSTSLYTYNLPPPLPTTFFKNQFENVSSTSPQQVSIPIFFMWFSLVRLNPSPEIN